MKHKKILLLAMMLTLFCDSLLRDAAAEPAYIKDLQSVSLRESQGTGQKSMRLLDSGTRLKVLENQGEWTKCELNDGQVGWILTRYLSSSAPKSLLYDRLEKQHALLTERIQGMQKEKEVLAQELGQMKKTMAEKEQFLRKTQQDFDLLKKDASDYLNLKGRFHESSSQLVVLGQKAQVMEKQLSDRNIHWFISGAGVLLTGFLIGLFSRRRRKSTSALRF